jgi:uncharacterized protein YgiM (DUF1202 family)
LQAGAPSLRAVRVTTLSRFLTLFFTGDTLDPASPAFARLSPKELAMSATSNRSLHTHTQIPTPAIAFALAAMLPLAAFSQTAPSTAAADTTPLIAVPTTAPTVTPLTQPPAATVVHPSNVPAAAGGGGGAPVAAEVPAVTQPFVATVTADSVYVRSGPGTAYYELGKLSKNDLVYVVGTSKGWYQILPPNGTFCLIAKELVEVDSSGANGTVKGDYVNVRAGTAINKNRDPIAVLTVVRKGTKLKVLGSNDKYYEVAPPDRAYVYVSPQFIRQSSGEYKVPELKLPAGVAGPSQATVSAPTTLPTATIEIPAAPTTPTPTTPEATAANTTETPSIPASTEPAAARTTVPVPAPAVTFSETATQKFNELNARYQEENSKPLAQRSVDGLIKDYKDLLTMPNLSPSVKLGTESRITALEKVAAIQRLSKENAAADESLTQQRQALQQQYAAAQAAIEAYQQSGPYIAEGVLKTSTIVKGRYALINPATDRVVAYVDPTSDIDIGSLVGKYIGVRGTSSTPSGSDITVIKVSNATLMPNPKAQ